MDNSEAVAARLLNSFDSLPWRYQLTFALPDQVSRLLPPTLDEFRLSPTVRLVRATADFAQTFPLVTEHKLHQKRIKGSSTIIGLLWDEPPAWKTETIYLQVLTEGFIGQWGGTSTSLNAERLVRAFCGLGIAVRLFAYKQKYSQGATKSYLYVHRKNADDTWSPECRLDVDDVTDRGLLGLEMHLLDGKLDTDEKQFDWAMYRLQYIGTALSGEKKAEPLILASQWLFDGHAGRDELLSFVQTMVVLEILLGDKKISDVIGIGELMRNRCAYLIGGSQRERTELLEDFNKIYHVRSQIVHSGKHRLTVEERRLFARLRWMCRRVIDK